MVLGITELKIKNLTIFPLNGKRPISISNSTAEIDYFESILEPTITMSINLFSSYSLFNEIPIRGGEKVEIELEVSSNTWAKDIPKSFSLEGDNAMYVYKVSDISASKAKELLTIRLISKEYFMNEQSKCLKKYQSNNISVHVKDILKNILQTKKDYDKNVEDTSNSYSFYGGNRKPFHVLQWLAPKSVSTSPGVKGQSGKGQQAQGKGTAGFLFYENKDGFHYRSIDELVDGLGNKKVVWKYRSDEIISAGKMENNTKIMKYFMEKNIDLRKSLRIGMYNNKTDFYDTDTNSFTTYHYKLSDEIKDKKLATGDIVPKGSKDDIIFNENSSRYMMRMSDHGITEPFGEIKETGRDHVDMAKSFARYNLLFTQALNILVPCNVNLRVGEIIKCTFPQLKSGKGTEDDPEISGYYLIRELRHHFEPNKNTTSLKLMRDSYGLY